MFASSHIAIAILMILVTVGNGAVLAQESAHDPGVRGGPSAAGQPLHGLTPIELQMFNEGVQRAIQLEAVCDDCADTVIGSFVDPAKANLVTMTNSSGLGTRFNADQCTVCHNQPALGGSGGRSIGSRCRLESRSGGKRRVWAADFPETSPRRRDFIH